MKIKVSTLAFSGNKNLVEGLLEVFPDAEFNYTGKRMNGESLIEFFQGAEGVIVGLEKITGDLLDKLPDLKIIAKYGVGLDNIDLQACAQRNIKIGWTAGVNRRSVAEMTLGFMLALCRNLFTTSNQLKNGIWNKSGGSQLSDKTIGIIGLGNIGREVVQLLAPFNCKILANDILEMTEYAERESIEFVSKEILYKESDIITIHTPLTTETDGLFDLNVFLQMKPSAFLINTARGGLIKEADLLEALDKNIISGAALDVYSEEPPLNQKLLSMPSLMCTPHIGGNSVEAVIAMGMAALNHLKAYKKNR